MTIEFVRTLGESGLKTLTATQASWVDSGTLQAIKQLVESALQELSNQGESSLVTSYISKYTSTTLSKKMTSTLSS